MWTFQILLTRSITKRNGARTGRSTSQHKQATETEKTKPKKRPQKDKERENEGANKLGGGERERENTPVANGNEQDQKWCWNSSWFHNSNSRSGLRKTKPHNPFYEVKLLILQTAYVGFETETKNSELKTTNGLSKPIQEGAGRKRIEGIDNNDNEEREEEEEEEGDGDEDEGDGVFLETQHSNGTIGRERLTLARK